MKLLPNSGVTRLRTLFATAQEYSDLTPTQYEEGLAWIREVGLVNNLRSTASVSEQIFDAALTHDSPLWFRDTDLLVQSPIELPDDALTGARALGITPSAAYGRVVAAWGKVDTAERSRIGNAGELALVALLREASPNLPVDHVAATCDGLGYDIAVSGSDEAHLEVKSTTRRGRLTFYLSRNEHHASMFDPAWQLVVVRLNTDLDIVSIATVPNRWIASHVPNDPARYGRWESCKLDVPSDVPIPGIQKLGRIFDGSRAGKLLTGTSG
ncbi:DUF3883 domain-containing protein [Nocardia carnea]|uniref:DUF3883 domain-containing protein n=1 Tax=Nocardia carnea TaxID=37328 RepID=UPI002456E8A4|nr:DUF3883 domain-containing protein [Nocardia carnea]